MIFKKIIPLSLLGRSIIIIFVPIIVLVIITSIIFYQTSWNIISKRLTQSVVADINALVKLIDKNLEFETMQIAKEDFKMTIKILESKSSESSLDETILFCLSSLAPNLIKSKAIMILSFLVLKFVLLNVMIGSFLREFLHLKILLTYVKLN